MAYRVAYRVAFMGTALTRFVALNPIHARANSITSANPKMKN